MKKIIVIMAAIIISFCTSVFASYKDALSLYQEKKYKESLEIIARELDVKKDMVKDSPNYDLRFLAAHNHWKLGNLNPAVSHFKRCADIKKDIPDPLIDLSFLMYEQKRYGDAAFFAGLAVKITEGPVSYYLLGKSAMKTGNYWKAKEYFEKVLSLDPEFATAYNDLGLVLMKLRKFSEANTAFSAALADMPDSAEVLNNIAMNYEASGRLDEALKYFSMANEKSPENQVVKTNFDRLKGKNAGLKKG
jgi:tetratricopeptide (TPR) repeat protein